MLLLTATTDKLQLVTSAAATVDVHASYMDHTLSTDNVEGGRQNTAISTATTTDIVAAPASGVVRNVKTLHIRNTHASTPTDVTVVFDANATDFELHKATLAAGETLQYVEGVGFAEPAAAAPPIVYNASLADQGPGFATDTYIDGSNLLIGGRIKVGTILRWIVHATKTAAGSATPIWIIRFGTAGTIADTARCTMTSPAGTAASDTARWEIDAVCRVSSATGVFAAAVGCEHTLDSTGFSVGNGAARVTSGTFDTTVAGIQAGISVNGGASAAWTIQAVTAEAVNLA